MTDEDMDLGTCCTCQNPDKHVRNIMSLSFRTPYGFGWGCFQCGLPMEGAIAVICDECLESNAEIREFVKGEALGKQRAPMSELTEPFDHDLSKHPEVNEPSIVVERHNLDEAERTELEEMGVEFEDDPVVLYDPESGPVTDSQLRQICEDVAALQPLRVGVSLEEYRQLQALGMPCTVEQLQQVLKDERANLIFSASFHDREVEVFVEPKEARTVEVHNVYTLYELNEDGSTAEQKLVCFNRPQDWGDPSRWHYHRCKTEFESHGTRYINHCHLWQEVERNPVEAFQAIAPYLFMVLQPGAKPELCGKDFLGDEDFWDSSLWGEMPPIYEGEDDYDDDYDPHDEAYQDPIPVGGSLYCWRVWHPDQEQAVSEAQENPFPEPPFPSASYLYSLTREDDRYIMRDDDEQPLHGFMFGTHLEDTPTLAQSWAEKGWQLESLGAMTKVAN
jgi:hypothetical protein